MYLFLDILQLLLKLRNIVQLNVIYIVLRVRCMRRNCIRCCWHRIVHCHTDSQFVYAERNVILSLLVIRNGDLRNGQTKSKIKMK